MRRRKKGKKFSLTNAWKRATLTLGSVSVMIKIPFKGGYIECATPAEAIEVLKHLAAEEEKRVRARNPSLLEAMAASLGGHVVQSPWTRGSFWKFVDSLGDSQTRALSLLVRKRKVTDEEMRRHLRLDSNQALAGVLSGISKQAGALNIPARSVYVVEDERKSGEVTKTYAVALDFLGMAMEMNWPPD